jgi:hypothetical protein
MSGVDFSNQKEATEYARRIGIEYAFSCEKVVDLCHFCN